MLICSQILQESFLFWQQDEEAGDLLSGCRFKHYKTSSLPQFLVKGDSRSFFSIQLFNFRILLQLLLELCAVSNVCVLFLQPRLLPMIVQFCGKSSTDSHF